MAGVNSSSPKPVFAYTAGELPKVFRSQKLARRLIKHQWLAPVVKQHRLVLYDVADVEAVWERLKRGEIPPPL